MLGAGAAGCAYPLSGTWESHLGCVAHLSPLWAAARPQEEMGRSRLTAWENFPVLPAVATSHLGCLSLPAPPWGTREVPQGLRLCQPHLPGPVPASVNQDRSFLAESCCLCERQLTQQLRCKQRAPPVDPCKPQHGQRALLPRVGDGSWGAACSARQLPARAHGRAGRVSAPSSAGRHRAGGLRPVATAGTELSCDQQCSGCSWTPGTPVQVWGWQQRWGEGGRSRDPKAPADLQARAEAALGPQATRSRRTCPYPSGCQPGGHPSQMPTSLTGQS